MRGVASAGVGASGWAAGVAAAFLVVLVALLVRCAPAGRDGRVVVSDAVAAVSVAC